MIEKMYTNAYRFGKNIRYLGYENGKRVQRTVPFSPTLYVTSKDPASKWKSLTGLPVEPIVFPSMKDAADFSKQYDDAHGFEIYGNTNFVVQYLNDSFPGKIKWDRSIINVTSLDIETKFENGFPEPTLADQEVTAITCKNNIDDIYYTFGCGDYDVEKSLMTEYEVKYIKCADERELLTRFVIHMGNVDVITGWNVDYFDIPYLVNRIRSVCGEPTLKKLSPWGDIKDATQKPSAFNPKPRPQYKIMGITILDYLEIYKKFTYTPQESYKLGHIAHVELGDDKLSYDEYTDLMDLYTNDYQKFIDYNIKDVEIIDRLEDKMGLITLALTMAYKGGVNYTDVLGTVAIWDAIIYRDLSLKHVAIPKNTESFKGDYPGGYVKAPQVGKHDWVCSFDLNSLYPSIIMQYNMSPETILDGSKRGVTIDDFIEGKVHNEVPNTAMAMNGVRFKTDKIGVLPSIIEDLYDERVGIKREMLDAQQAKEAIDPTDKTSIYAADKKISIAKNNQMAIKILLNSLYGAMGNKWFRYFDMRIAEGITLTGQTTIKWAEKHLNEYLNKILETNDDYVIAIDTDSVYITLGELVRRVNPPNPVDFLDKVCSSKLEDVLIDCYADLYSRLGGRSNKMVMGREVIANRGIWTAKKRYILNVHDNEGVRYAKPKLKIMGIEAIKSSTPAICRQALKDIFITIIDKEEKDVQDDIAAFKTLFKAASPEEVSFPRGVNEITKWQDKKTLYKKGCPIHVRGSILHNNFIKEKKLGKKITDIHSGDKVKFTYLKKPNPLKENVISFIDFLPKQFGLEAYIDYNMQFEKTFMSVIEPILDSIGYEPEQVVNLEDFFS